MMTAGSLGASLRTQCRIVGALLIRESLTRYGRHNLGFLWLFLEPMLFTVGVVGLWTAMRTTHGSDLPIAAFAITGYSSVLLWRNMPARCLSAIEPNLALMHHRNVRVMDFFIARLLLEVVGVTTSFALLTVVFLAAAQLAAPEDVLLIAAGWVLLAWFGAAVAVVIACLAQRSELVEKFWHPLSYLIFPLSGAGFMVDWLPAEVRSYALMVPTVHATEMLRAGFFGSAVRTWFDGFYLFQCCLVLSLLAAALLRDVARRVMPE